MSSTGFSWSSVCFFWGGSYEHGLERLGSMKGGQFVYWLSGHELLQKDFSFVPLLQNV
jgi:hypothetical protein